MSLRPWYNQEANYQTNAKSFMDYLARTNKFLEVLIEDYENFQELVIEELERIKFDSEIAVDDILLKWLEDGTLARIINDGVLGNKADKTFVDVELEKVATQLTQKADKTLVNERYELLDNKIEDFNFVNLKDFDVKGDGASDDTLKIQNALDLAFNENKTLYIPNGVYPANELEIKVPLLLGKNVKFKFNGVSGGKLLSILTNDTFFTYLNLDGDHLDCSLLILLGDNNTFGKIKFSNITLSTETPNHCYGVFVGGQGNSIELIEGSNLINGGYWNESFPQSVVTAGLVTTINTIRLKNIAAGLVTTGSTEEKSETFLTNLYIENASDNGIYNLPNSSIRINYVYYNGSEEPAVFAGDNVFVDTFHIKGKGSRIGFQNVENVRINNLHFELGDDGTSVNSLFRTRASNTVSGKISIGEISGEIISDGDGMPLFLLNNGLIKYFTIEKMNITQSYTGVYGDLSQWANMGIIEQFKIDEVYIKIIDLDNQFTSDNIFYMRIPIPTKKSYFNDLVVEIVKSDGATKSPAVFRGMNLNTPLTNIRNMQFQANIGPYAREKQEGFEKSINTNPSVGYWHKGSFYYNSVVNETNIIGWLCVESGTPGVWRAIE